MARIFIADVDDGVATLQRILGPYHDISHVDRLKDAVDALSKDTYDLIIVGIHFDESQMFELMLRIKTLELNADKPIICYCGRDTALMRVMHRSLDYTCRSFGAWMYLNQHEYSVAQDPDAEMRRIIERCLTHEARKEAFSKRLDIQEQREEIHRLRQALESAEWTVELEDRLGNFRRKLSKILLVLYQTLLNSDDQIESIALSRFMQDRVSDSVTSAENEMTRQETEQRHRERDQATKERELADREELRSEEGRNRDDRKSA